MAHGTENEVTDFLRGVTTPYVIMGVGLPKSGKSEALSGMSRDLSIEIISPLAIRRELAARGLYDTKAAWQKVDERIGDSLEIGIPVIVDAVHIDPVRAVESREPLRRARLVEKYKEYGARAAIAVVFDLPLADVLSRFGPNDSHFSSGKIATLHRNLSQVPVTHEEGFDLIAKQKGRGQPIRIDSVHPS